MDGAADKAVTQTQYQNIGMLDAQNALETTWFWLRFDGRRYINDLPTYLSNLDDGIIFVRTTD